MTLVSAQREAFDEAELKETAGKIKSKFHGLMVAGITKLKPLPVTCGEGACHTGRRSCFYRAVPLKQSGAIALEFRDADKAFDPGVTYKK